MRKDPTTPIECIETPDMVLNRAYRETLDALGLDSFESVWRYPGGELVKRIKQRSVVRIRFHQQGEEQSFYLKRHFQGKRNDERRILAAGFGNRSSEGRKEFLNILGFRNQGLGTVTPVAAGERARGVRDMDSFLLTEDFSPYVSLESLLKRHPDLLAGEKREQTRRQLLEQIAVFARRMHAAGYNHRDFNATHILVKHTDTDALGDQIAVFDLQRVDRRQFLRFRWMIKTLANVNYSLPSEVFPLHERPHLLAAYKGRGRLRLRDRFEWFWIRKKTDKIRRHTEKIMIRRERETMDGSAHYPSA